MVALLLRAEKVKACADTCQHKKNNPEIHCHYDEHVHYMGQTIHQIIYEELYLVPVATTACLLTLNLKSGVVINKFRNKLLLQSRKCYSQCCNEEGENAAN